MLLYTAHAREAHAGQASVAQETGLERRLGFAPLFCTLLDPGSLADTWFRAYAASPSYVQVVDVYEVDDAAAAPMDVVTWCDECLGRGEADHEALSRALAPSDATCVDYLLDPSAVPRRTWRFDVLDILNGRLDGLGLGGEDRERAARSMAAVRAFPRRPDVSLASSLGGGYDSITLEVWYRLMLTASFMPLVWSHVTGKALPGELLALDPGVLAATPGFAQAQADVAAWDRSIGSGESFGHERFAVMRASFLRALDELAAQVVAGRARRAGVSRNDACICGSGLKFKRCCSRKSLDELAASCHKVKK